MNFNKFQQFKSLKDPQTTISDKGFTFVETLVAVTILTIALAGTLTIVSRSVQSSVFSRDQIIAFYLAQEAIELLQNKRSTNVLEGNDWLEDIVPICSEDPCVIWVDTDGSVDIRKDTAAGCGGFACQPLRFDGVIYNHDPSKPGNQQTIFDRSLQVESIDYDGLAPPDEIAVSVIITWNTGTITRDFTLRQNLLNWQ